MKPQEFTQQQIERYRQMTGEERLLIEVGEAARRQARDHTLPRTVAI